MLVGMMGAGKSAVGHRLAARLDLRFVDADTEIVAAAGGISIPEIFAIYGEANFRSLEARVIARLINEGSRVLATGGGAFMNADTRAAVCSKGISVWLKAELSVLMERIMRKGIAARPMLKNGDPAETLKRLMETAPRKIRIYPVEENHNPTTHTKVATRLCTFNPAPTRPIIVRSVCDKIPCTHCGSAPVAAAG